MAKFEPGEAAWIDKLDNLRNTIRQEVIGRQISTNLGARRSVLDVGCGQGTQAIRLLRAGCSVVGVEPSPALRERFRTDAAAAGVDPDIRPGTIEDLDRVVATEVFDLVCAHGLLMYLAEPGAAIADLAQRVAPGGLLSVTIKNGHSLAHRPALRGDWSATLDALADDHGAYVNELGVNAQAHRLEQAESWLAGAGLELHAWYGVRVFNDGVAGTVLPPTDGSLEQILDAEDLGGRTDPYRWLGSQIHLLAQAR